MANSIDLNTALIISNLRLSALGETIVMKELIALEERLIRAVEDNKEVRSPYEFN